MLQQRIEALTPRLKQYGYLLRLERPIGSLLLGWSTLWGLWLAGEGSPPAYIVFILLVGTFSARSLGCALNDVADRNFDNKVERTKNRPLTSGQIKLWEALLVIFILAAFNLYLATFLNWQSLTFALFCGAISIIYPLCKRFFILPQLVLGLAFAAPILMAQLAINGKFSFASLTLYLASAFWALVYDTFYALIDRSDDLKIGLRSSAIFAQGREKRFLSLMAVIMLFLLILTGIFAELNGWYFGSLVVVAFLFAYEIYRIRHLKSERFLQAFLHNSWIGAGIFAGLVLNYLPQ